MQKIVAVFDDGSGFYMRPFVVPAVPAAIRSFSDECSRADSVLAMHPKDFRLYLLGDFDETSGVISQDDKYPVLLCGALDFVKEKRDVSE